MSNRYVAEYTPEMRTRGRQKGHVTMARRYARIGFPARCVATAQYRKDLRDELDTFMAAQMDRVMDRLDAIDTDPPEIGPLKDLADDPLMYMAKYDCEVRR